MTQKRTKAEIQQEIDRLQGELQKTELQEKIHTLTQELYKSETPSQTPQNSGVPPQKKGLSWRKIVLICIGGLLILNILFPLSEEEKARIQQERIEKQNAKKEKEGQKEQEAKNIQDHISAEISLTNAQKAEVIEKMIQENTSGFLACRNIDMSYNKKVQSSSQRADFAKNWGISLQQVKYLAEQCGVAAKKNPPNYDFLPQLLKELGGKQKGFSGGMYKVGKDIPAGEYVIIGSGYLEISADSSGDFGSIIENDNYKNRTIILVKDGEYLTFKGYAYTWDDAPAFQNPKLVPEGKYKVGKDFPAGEYKIFPLVGSGYYEVNPTARGDEIVSNDNFDHEIYLTVQNGQYLKLSRAELLLK